MTTGQTALKKDHSFNCESTDSRSPCPALNALSNHGYLPRDGRRIGMGQLVGSLREVYNLSYPLAIILATVGMVFCGKWWSLPWKIDLHDLAQHNRIEHDCSLTHPDAAQGAKYAPNHVSFTLLERLLDVGKADHLHMNDFIAARIKRALDDPKPLDAVHKEIAHGEAALTMLVLGTKPVGDPDSKIAVPRNFIYQWFGEDRLPDGWSRPSKQIGLRETVSLSAAIKDGIHAKDAIALCA